MKVEELKKLIEEIDNKIIPNEHWNKVKDYITNLQQENEKLKLFINNLISQLNHCELNGTKKLDIVSDYIKQEYENTLQGSGKHETK